MLSHIQFNQLKKMLENNTLHEVICRAVFYSSSTSAKFHSNSCRQKYFRLRKLGVLENELIKDEPKIVQLPEQVEEEQEILNQLIEKSKIYTNKLNAI
jgi:hypothetical protein